MRHFVNQRSRASGDSWQVIYMDLMTMIMVFFVILWSINQKQESGISQTVGDETVKIVNLPGDVLFASGQSSMSGEGQSIFKRLFDVDPETDPVLSFDTGGLAKRLLVIHGHTDGDGDKHENLELGYQRASAAYKEIHKYSEDLADHVVICTHADNSPVEEVPEFTGNITADERAAIRDAKKKNRRITIEDKVVNTFSADDE